MRSLVILRRQRRLNVWQQQAPCTLVDRSGAAERVRAVELQDGPDRDAVIAVTTHLPARTGRIY